MSDHDFNTPPWILDLVRQMDHRGIGLDPCSNAFSMVRAKTAYTVEDDGLSFPWRGHGLVFINPPHSVSPFNIEPWMEKAWAEFEHIDREDQPFDSLIMLHPAKPDTGWFHKVVTKMDARCFLEGRPRYYQNGIQTPGPGKFAVMLSYRGYSVGRFMSLFERYGWVV